MAVPSEISSSWSIAQSWGHRDEMSARFGADVCGQWGELHHAARPLRVSDPDGAVPERPRSPYAAACALPVLPWRGRSVACHPISSEHARTHRIGAVACDGRHNMTLLPGPPPGRYLPSSWPGCDITVWQLGRCPGARHRAPAADLPAEDHANSRLRSSVVCQLHSEPGVHPRICRDVGLGTTGTNSGRLLATQPSACRRRNHRDAVGRLPPSLPPKAYLCLPATVPHLVVLWLTTVSDPSPRPRRPMACQGVDQICSSDIPPLVVTRPFSDAAGALFHYKTVSACHPRHSAALMQPTNPRVPLCLLGTSGYLAEMDALPPLNWLP